MPGVGDRISVVIPVFRARESLPILADRLEAQLAALGRDYEVVFVDDCSPDGTWAVLKGIKERHPRFKIIRLLRNSGQHNAILCGFSQVSGDVVVTMDDDLQNPPEEIPKLIDGIDRGFDLVIGAYDSKKHGRLRNAGGGLVDAVQRRVFGLPRDFQLTSFRAVRRVVVDHVNQMAGAYPYVTSMLLSQTSCCTNVPVRHESRAFGRSNYDLRRSGLLALNLILSYSPYPLYLVGLLFALSLAVALISGLDLIARVAWFGSHVPGWVGTTAIVSAFSSLILLALVVLGIYVSRINQQVARTRVNFSIGEVHG